MKYLLVFLVVMLVAWRWRSARTEQQLQSRNTAAARAATPVDMVRCAQCGVHVPSHDVIPGTRGSYCSTAHLKAAEH